MIDESLNSKIFAIFFMISAVYCNFVSCNRGISDCGSSRNCPVRDYYEENKTYASNPHCKPSRLDTGIQCGKVGPTIDVKGDLYSGYGFHYVPLASAYYVARFADAMGFQKQCPTNTTFLKELGIIAPWSGLYGGVAADGACGFKKQASRQCTFPSGKYPFLCTGIEGPPGTYGRRLETLSYVSILQGSNLRWTLFISCWRAKTPQNPKSEEIATSFHVFSLDPELSCRDRNLIIKELKSRRFNTDPSNLIEFNYFTNPCNFEY